MPDKRDSRKDQLLRELVEARQAVLKAARRLPQNKQTEVFLGTWSAADLLAHLVGWDFTNLEAARELGQGKQPSFYDYADKDWRSYNAQLVARYMKEDFRELLAALEHSHRQLLEYLEGLPQLEIPKDRGVRYEGWKVTIERLLRAEASDEREHARQLEEFAVQGVEEK